jgi:hypothetical protein
MKMHLQKTRIQGGKKYTYSIPECGKSGRVNGFLHLASTETFKIISEKDKSRCCVNCLAALK